MRRLVMVLGVIATVGFAGCGPSPAARDFEKICNAEAMSGAAAVADPAAKALTIAKWLEANISSEEAASTMSGLGMAAPDQRGELLKRAAAEAGYTGPCPMAELR